VDAVVCYEYLKLIYEGVVMARVQYVISDSADAWMRQVSKVLGMPMQALCERLIRYQAGAMTEREEIAFQRQMEVAVDLVEVDFNR